MLVHEVFACGVLPYADQFDNRTETSSFVKEGGQLNRLNAEACPVEVYEQLMLPCFAADPADRPTFGALHAHNAYNAVAVRHGAAEDDDALRQRAQARKASVVLDNGPVDRALLGPSVHHLASALLPGVQQAIVANQLDKGHAKQSRFDGTPRPRCGTPSTASPSRPLLPRCALGTGRWAADTLTSWSARMTSAEPKPSFRTAGAI